MFPCGFSKHPQGYLFLQPLSFCIALTTPPQWKSPTVLCFPSPLSQHPCPAIPPSRAPSPDPYHQYFQTFLVSAVTPCSLGISEDLKLESTDEREHVCLSCQVWVPSLDIVFSSSIHFPASLIFFFAAEKDSLVQTYRIFIILFFTWRALRLFHSPAIVNRTAMNMAEQISQE